MNKKTLVPLIGVAFAVALVATGIFYGLFASRLGSGGSDAQIAVAARDLERGTVLAEADISMKGWPAASVPEGAFPTAAAAIGQSVIDPIHKGEPILQARVASKETGGALGIPVGMRAVSIHLAEPRGIAAMLKTSHRVDVQLISLPGQSPELKTILQNVTVLRVDPGVEGNSNPVITLLLPPLESDEVALADASARIRLLLRHPLDDAAPSLPRQTLPPLFLKNTVAPAKK